MVGSCEYHNKSLGMDCKETGHEGWVDSTILQQGVMVDPCDQGNRIHGILEITWVAEQLLISQGLNSVELGS
jgi:hypothetical protein